MCFSGTTSILRFCELGLVGETLKALRGSPKTVAAKAKFVLATDGDTLEAEDLITGETIASKYRDFPCYFSFFLPLAGISTVKEIKDNPMMFGLQGVSTSCTSSC